MQTYSKKMGAKLNGSERIGNTLYLHIDSENKWQAGFDPTKPGTLYIGLAHTRQFGTVLKYGITNTFKSRKDTHRRTLEKLGGTIEWLYHLEFANGLVCENCELHIKQNPAFRVINMGVEGFVEECTDEHHLAEILSIVKRFKRLDSGAV